MRTLADEARGEIVRGVLLTILIQYHLDWVPFRTLRLMALRGQGYLLSDEELKFHLAYLSDTTRMYAETKPLSAAGAELFVRATAKAVDLRDGRIPDDPGIQF
ncbi:MAG TPA: hypothetical protein VFD30_21575 [Terriglobia bacterium]|jgi:hypothetical protein|nr:hypothetical protein [Terriglobia bacterium]